ncbi:DUF4153 domain-containing protein [Butyrivibrio sp. VCB2001]|uniref:DUF4153 domain-containing protein n=1 Tax=Butyrivibrio sp. VCB2001 TaxID=1280667 RepID=UPI0003F8114B|nr:DUF4153 domain-containing protein [Butyrivibrio sp. VCB2001]
MLWFKKLKEDARGIFKEHPASIISVFIFAVCTALLEDILNVKDHSSIWKILTFIQTLSLGLIFGFVLCESNYNYKKQIGKLQKLFDGRGSLVYIIVMVISLLLSMVHAYRQAYVTASDFSDSTDLGIRFDIFYRFFWVYIAVCLISAWYFMYKKSGESFESYSVKAFLGSLKALAVYAVVAIGFLCIIWVFDSLIVSFDYAATVELLIAALVGYPALLVGLSKMGENMARFSKVMVGYVFTGLLAVAAVIVYVYLLKIIFTWTFPSNEAYTITTSLFATGLVVITMAQGCTEGGLLKVLKISPLFFVPFIVVQIMCLSMRIGQYGITTRRYLGIMFIVFEVIYLIYYVYRLRRQEGIGGFLFPVALILVVIYYLVPGINVYAAITGSQKGVVMKYVVETASGNEINSQEKAKAKSAYRQIENNGNAEGLRFLKELEEKYPDIDFGDELGTSDSYYYEDTFTNDKEIYAYNDVDVIDVSRYKNLAVISTHADDDTGEIDISRFELKASNGQETSVVGYADLSFMVKELEAAYDNDGIEYDFTHAISTPIVTPDGGLLYLTRVYLRIGEDGDVEYLDIDGYYAYH